MNLYEAANTFGNIEEAYLQLKAIVENEDKDNPLLLEVLDNMREISFTPDRFYIQVRPSKTLAYNYLTGADVVKHQGKLFTLLNSTDLEEVIMNINVTAVDTKHFHPDFVAKANKVMEETVAKLLKESYIQPLLSFHLDTKAPIQIVGGVIRDYILGVDYTDIDVFVGDNYPHNTIADKLEGWLMSYGHEKDEDKTKGYGGKSTMVGSYNIVRDLRTMDEIAFNISRFIINLWSQGAHVEYSLQGVEDLLVNKRVEATLRGNQTHSNFLKYVTKLSKKEYLQDYTITASAKGATETRRLGDLKDVELNADDWDISVYTCGHDSLVTTPFLTRDHFKVFMESDITNTTHPDLLDIMIGTSTLIEEVMPQFEYMDSYEAVLWYGDYQDHLPMQRVRFQRDIQATMLSPSEFSGWDGYTVEGVELLRQGKARLAQGFKDTGNVTKDCISYLKSKGLYAHLSKTVYHCWEAKEALSMARAVTKHPKLKELPMDRGVQALLCYVVWSQVFAVANIKEMSSYWLMHFKPSYVNIEVPLKHQHYVASTDSAMRWLFDNNLEVDWNSAKGTKSCIMNALSKAFDTTDDRALEDFFKNPGKQEALAWYKENKDSVAEDYTPNLDEVLSNGWKVEKLAKSDFTNLVIGSHTSCCQYIGGYGDSVCKETWKDPNSINYVLRNPKGEITTHWWCWMSTDNVLVIDSIESQSSVPMDIIVEAVKATVAMAYRHANGAVLSCTDYGVTPKVRALIADNLGKEEAPPTPVYLAGYDYYDARYGVVPVTLFN